MALFVSPPQKKMEGNWLFGPHRAEPVKIVKGMGARLTPREIMNCAVVVVIYEENRNWGETSRRGRT